MAVICLRTWVVQNFTFPMVDIGTNVKRGCYQLGITRSTAQRSRQLFRYDARRAEKKTAILLLKIKTYSSSTSNRGRTSKRRDARLPNTNYYIIIIWSDSGATLRARRDRTVDCRNSNLKNCPHRVPPGRAHNFTTFANALSDSPVESVAAVFATLRNVPPTRPTFFPSSLVDAITSSTVHPESTHSGVLCAYDT